MIVVPSPLTGDIKCMHDYFCHREPARILDLILVLHHVFIPKVDEFHLWLTTLSDSRLRDCCYHLAAELPPVLLSEPLTYPTHSVMNRCL